MPLKMKRNEDINGILSKGLDNKRKIKKEWKEQ